MALMHDYIIRANFTTRHLKEKFFAFALVVLGYSIQLYCLGNTYLCKTSQLDNFKMRLGGEISLSGIKMHKGHLNSKGAANNYHRI